METIVLNYVTTMNKSVILKFRNNEIIQMNEFKNFTCTHSLVYKIKFGNVQLMNQKFKM